MWSLTHFDDTLDKMKGLQEPTSNIMICKLLVVDPACAIRLSRRKVLFSVLKFVNMTPLNNDSRKVQKSKPNLPLPPPLLHHFKRVSHQPPHFKNCSAGPGESVIAGVKRG